MNNTMTTSYIEKDSWLHTMEPRIKFLWISVILLIFANVSSVLQVSLLFLLNVFIIKSIGFSLQMFKHAIGAIQFIFFMTLFFEVIFGDVTTAFWRLGPLELGWPGIERVIVVTGRIGVLILFSSLLTMTTKLTQLTNVFLWLLYPFQAIGVRINEWALMLSVALRFIPIIIEEGTKIKTAQSARGVDWSNKNIFAVATAYTSLLVPLTLQCIYRAETMGVALELKGFDRNRKVEIPHTPFHLHGMGWITSITILSIGIVFVL
ncbi:MAG: energy-coupling factor transporter transmembrane component T family protein [Bacilli bacterium]